MSKKLITACMALVALTAFALPAVASASPEVTHPTGTRLATGKKVTATQVGSSTLTSTTTTGSGEVLFQCSSGSMTGELTKNNGTEIEGTIEAMSLSGTAPESKCTGLGGIKFTFNVGNGVPWCIRATSAMSLDEFQIRGGKCNEAQRGITFKMDTGLGIECSYERTTPIKGTFTTDTTGDAILTLNGEGETGKSDVGFTREGTSALCPASGTLDMQFTLETDSSTAEPLYISESAVPGPEMTHPTGTRWAGGKILATQLSTARLTSTTGEKLAECSSASMTGTLTKNDGIQLEGNIETTTFAGTEAGAKCTGLGGVTVTTNVGNGVPWCLKANGTMAADEFQVRGGKCSEASRSITFLLDTGLGVNCGYERTAPIKGKLTTDTSGGDAIATLTGSGETGISDTGFTREGTNVLCPASGTLDMEFTLETDSLTAEPLYIS